MPDSVSRRRFLARAIAASALAMAPLERLAAAVRFRVQPFQLGVASGEPTPDGFVIWTRLAPEPLEPERLGTTMFEVTWEVATDHSFSRIVASGSTLARPHLAHAVHVEVNGLASGSEYFYRFRLGRYESPVGRAVTTPAAGASVERLRFGVSSCAHYEQGYFSAYRYMADDGLDLMLTLGDYIYEYSGVSRHVRLFDTVEAVTLDDYRRRYSSYRSDADLQAAHAACPWLITWDDHEVENDYAGLISENEACGAERARERFATRRAAAYKAWFEHMPVRPSRLLAGGAIRLWDTVDWGTLARFYLLDTRQHRSPLACYPPGVETNCDLVAGTRIRPGGTGGGLLVDPRDPGCKAALEDPARTMLGLEQEQWLESALAASRARWNLLAQAVMLVPFNQGSQESPLVWTDAWSGYAPARERLLAALGRHRVSNPVVLSGDLHTFWMNEVADARGRPLAVELLTSSIATTNRDYSRHLPVNPHVKFHDGGHSGYIRCELDSARLLADIIGVDDIRDPRSGRKTLASFAVTDGQPRLQRL